MPISQVLYSLNKREVMGPGNLVSEEELESVLFEHIDLLDPNWFVIGRQWVTLNSKRLDLLCLEKGGGLVVVELKKDMTPRDVTAQVIEYASFVSKMTMEDIKKEYERIAGKYLNKTETFEQAYHNHFGDDFDETLLERKPKMVIVASQMDDGTERIIRYLREEYSVDINIIFFKVFQSGEERVLSRAWLMDNEDPEIRQDNRNEWNKEYYFTFGNGEQRNWSDAMKYGFVSAGGGKFYTQTMKMLHPGDRIWVYIPKKGYVGVGIVQAGYQQASNAFITVNGEDLPMEKLELKGDYFYNEKDPDTAEYIVPVQWIKAVPEEQALRDSGYFGNQNTVCRPTAEKWDNTVTQLKKRWNISD